MGETEGGLEPQTDGWFVVNAADAVWWHNDAFGEKCRFEARELLFRSNGTPPDGRVDLLEAGDGDLDAFINRIRK